MGKKHKKEPVVYGDGPRQVPPPGPTVWYRQCVLRDGSRTTTTWLKEKRIKEGFRVTLKNSEDPERLWTIESMGLRQDEDWVRNKRMSHTHWRDHTDV